MVARARTKRVKPAEVAADTRKNFIPLIKAEYASTYPPNSILYREPWRQLPVKRQNTTRPPTFVVQHGDPVMSAIECSIRDSRVNVSMNGSPVRVPFICAVNENEPGGDWDTASSGYEEQLCRRSNFVATLKTPSKSSRLSSNYPIPSSGAILSDNVVVCRGPPDGYERLDKWYDLPVVSIAPMRRPKLKDDGSRYSFEQEYDATWRKMRGALCVCLHHGYDRVIIGDFGLGNNHRNPPQVLAEMWRNLFLFDPELRGQFTYVVFTFEDASQSTRRIILDEAAKSHCKSSANGKSSRDGSFSSSSSSDDCVADIDIFAHVFSSEEVHRVVSEPDPRYGLHMITS